MIIFIIIAIITPISNNLTTLIGLLILRALSVTIIIARLFNSWFSLILFLIYITGLLVLFRYILAINPNPRYSKLRPFVVLFCLFNVIFMKMFVKPVSLPIRRINYEWEVVTIFSFINSRIYWFIAIILLLALVLVVRLCFKTPSPLRSFLNCYQSVITLIFQIRNPF